MGVSGVKGAKEPKDQGSQGSWSKGTKGADRVIRRELKGAVKGVSMGVYGK